MDQQQFINILIMLCGCFGGFYLKRVNSSIEKIQSSSDKTSERINDILLLVTRDYVSKAEHEKTAAFPDRSLSYILNELRDGGTIPRKLDDISVNIKKLDK